MGPAPFEHGTTSACAENTTRRHGYAPSPRNYLRVRGEYPAEMLDAYYRTELPPRARRIPREVWGVEIHQGTTSACAENTKCLSLVRKSVWNYLRVRGEYTNGNTARIPSQELPPRARRIHGDGFETA